MPGGCRTHKGKRAIRIRIIGQKFCRAYGYGLFLQGGEAVRAKKRGVIHLFHLQIKPALHRICHAIAQGVAQPYQTRKISLRGEYIAAVFQAYAAAAFNQFQKAQVQRIAVRILGKGADAGLIKDERRILLQAQAGGCYYRRIVHIADLYRHKSRGLMAMGINHPVAEAGLITGIVCIRSKGDSACAGIPCNQAMQGRANTIKLQAAIGVTGPGHKISHRGAHRAFFFCGKLDRYKDRRVINLSNVYAQAAINRCRAVTGGVGKGCLPMEIFLWGEHINPIHQAHGTAAYLADGAQTELIAIRIVQEDCQSGCVKYKRLIFLAAYAACLDDRRIVHILHLDLDKAAGQQPLPIAYRIVEPGLVAGVVCIRGKGDIAVRIQLHCTVCCRTQAVPGYRPAFRVSVVGHQARAANDEAAVFQHAQAVWPNHNGLVHGPHLKLQMPLNRAPVIVIRLVVKRGCAGKTFLRHKAQHPVL